MIGRGIITIDFLFNFKDTSLVSLYIESGRLQEATEILEKSLSQKMIDFGKESRHLNTALILLSKIHLLKGDYAEAEQHARRANNIMTGIFGEQSSKVVPSMLALALVNKNLGDYQKAEGLLQQAITYQKREFGDLHVDVGKSISELALVKFYQQAPIDEITGLFEEAERIIGLKLGKENPTYAEVLKNLAIAKIAVGEYEQAFENLDIAGKIWNKKIGRRNNINAASVDVLKGDTYYKMGEYSRADNRYVDAVKKYEKFFSDSHPEYVKVKSKLAKTYYMNGDWRRALNQIDEVLLKYRDFVQEYFPALSEREKAKYWNTIKPDYEFFNTLIVSKNRNDKYIGELYNNALLTKALLLNSSIKIRQRIMSGDNTELKNIYNDWVLKKELLTTALSMTREQLLENNIDQSKLSNEVEALEKELSLKSDIFGSNYEQETVTWEDVKDVLNENEVAIEMVRFRVFEKEFTDSIKYALLYVTGEKRSKPKMILLDNGDELESKYLNYYRNSIKYQIRDSKSYDAFWKPIIDEIGTVATIYVSPDGVYNQINLEAIPTPEPNKYVIDNSNIILVSNTKDLYLKKDEESTLDPNTQLVATMFGDPIFYIETNPGTPVRTSGISRETAVVINQLPGTKKEIEQVKGYLNRNGWDVQEFAELDAREEIVKTITSPKIFHVATHGFFQQDKPTASAVDQELYQNYLYENPLLKSGLLLSGAGDILNTTKYNYNSESGILTAYEAMNLNLDQTELVVLSACETGLGEVEAGEGVYGLQRSFLVAGAKSVIMSLFKVSDDVTQQLMVRFYQKWLESGDKRKAFSDAKKEIRNEYPDPIYWGPFVMIGSK
jgi:CHAT domain-containing protein